MDFKEDKEKEAEIPVDNRSSRQKWKRRLRINRKLIALKFLIFIMNGATNILYPFFIIHCLSTGLTLTESGVIFALIPLFGCFGNPLAGFLADKLGDYKKVVVSFILLSVVCYGLLGFAVPVYSKKISSVSHNITDASLHIECSSTESSKMSIKIQPNSYLNPSSNWSSNSDSNSNWNWNSILNSDGECNLEKRSISNSKQRFIKSCENDCDSKQGDICVKGHCFPLARLEETDFPKISEIIPKENSTFVIFGNLTLTLPERAGEKQAVEVKGDFLNCPQERRTNCSVTCHVIVDHLFLVCKKTEISGNRLTTFFLYALFRVVGAMAVSSVMMLIDAAALLMVKQHDGDFGIQRTFGLIGRLAFPPLAGYLVEVASVANKKQDYSPLFYLFCSMFTVGAVTTSLMDLHIKPPGKQIWTNVWNLMKNVKVSSFVIVMFLVGCFYGILENYLFWYMQTFLKSPKWLLGMTNTVAGLSAIPVVAASSWIIKTCGHTKIFMMALVIYGVRFLAYSFVYDPYLILPVEVLEAWTFSLTWVVATVYSGKVAPTFFATLQGLVGAMHYSIGRGVGSLIAGALFDHYPPRFVYQLVAGASTSCAIIYAILHYVWLRRAPDPKSNHSHPDESKLDKETPQRALDAEKELDQVHLALLEMDHPELTPVSPDSVKPI